MNPSFRSTRRHWLRQASAGLTSAAAVTALPTAGFAWTSLLTNEEQPAAKNSAELPPPAPTMKPPMSTSLPVGKFTRVDTIRTWAILAGSAIGLLASALGRLYSSTFYALRDTRTPLWFAVARILLAALLGYLFAFPVPRMLGLPAWTGAVGLSISSGLSGWVEFLLLKRALSARIGHTGIPMTALVRLWGAGALGAAGGWGAMYLLAGRHQTLRGIIALLSFAAIYGAATFAFGVPEARALAGRLRRR